MANIGFIGLGHMGLPMAANLVKAGHQVTGFDLSQGAMLAFANEGGRCAQDIGDCARGQQIIITMLQTGQQVQQVCLGATGLYALANQALHIDCSSIDVESSRQLHQAAVEKGLLAVDAPVSGGVGGATAGTLTIMVGGGNDAFAAALPILQAMGKNIIHTGASGNGQAAKICNNMILGISMIAVSEAFVLADKLGLSADKLFEVVNNSSGQCWAMSKYVPVPGLLPNVPANNDYQPGFTAAMMLKDLLLSQHSAEQANIHISLGELATRIYQQFNDDGFGQKDFSAIINRIKDHG
ncbi:3-hydroxyisobutyrate dehydrogenase [Legionella dresdenensis]|uniref:3-hydroxyisobutyrate dehydrogenase n=1 Tax=Legionella dresdenensis TaxID=450200 RepID=A0ABV8CDC5_9GAMM